MNDHQPVITLRLALESMTAEELKKLVTLIGQKLPTRKSDMVDAIVHHFADDGLRTAWEGLNELQKAAVAEAAHSSSSTFDAARFGAKYGQAPDWGSKEKYEYARRPSALCLFLYRGYMLPADLKARLLEFVPAPPKPVMASSETVPSTYPPDSGIGNSGEEVAEEIPLLVHETERAAQRELLSVLRLVDAGKIAVSDKTRRPSSTSMDAITAIFEGGDYYPQNPPVDQWDHSNTGPIRAFAWPMLIQAGGLAQLVGKRLQLTKAGRKALSEPPAVTIRTLWTKWLDTTILDELSRIDCVKGQTGRGKRSLTAASGRRATISEGLASCPPGRWVKADELDRYILASGKYFSVADEDWGLYIEEQQYGSLGYDGNEMLNDRYLLSLLHEYAATLGMIDLAVIPPEGARDDFRSLWGAEDLSFFSRYDGLVYFRLTPLGAYCLGVENGYQPAAVEVKPVIRVLPNLKIAAIEADLEQGDILALNAYATPVSDLVWRLEPGRLLAAIEAGRQVAEVREFLEARSGTELPETVVQLLDDVAARCTLLQDRGLARLIECADAALAELIANDSRTRRYCMRAGDRHLVVAGESETAFRRALRDVGYLLGAHVERPAKNRAATEPSAAG